MAERKFKLGDIVTGSKDCIVGEVVELSTFKPDGKRPTDFKPGLYGAFSCGVVWSNSKTATYHFESNLDIVS